MASRPAQLRASTLWEAACERLHDALQPQGGSPAATPAQRVSALQSAYRALGAIEEAFDIGLPTGQRDEAGASTGDAVPGPHRDLVAIGTTSESVATVARLIADLPADFSAAVLVAIGHDASSDVVTEIKRAGATLPVLYPRDGDPIERGSVYLSPPDTNLVVRPSFTLGLEKSPLDAAPFRPIDRLFVSVAHVYGQRALGVILSGFDGDGVEGMNAIEEADGIGVVQDPDEAEIAELPSHVLSQDRPHYVAPLGAIATLLNTLMGQGDRQHGEPDVQRD